jgi:TonB family protein
MPLCPECGTAVTIARDNNRRGDLIEVPKAVLCAACATRKRRRWQAQIGPVILVALVLGAVLWRLMATGNPEPAPAPRPAPIDVRPAPSPGPAPPLPAPPLSTPPRASPDAQGPKLLDGAQLITADDYPARAQREGREGAVRVGLEVGPDGRVARCSIAVSSGHSDLDDLTCKLFVQRARFDPARNLDGEAIASRYTNRVRWQIQR